MATPTQAKKSPSSVSSLIPPRPHWSSKFFLALLFFVGAFAADQATKFFAPSWGFDMQLNGGMSLGLLNHVSVWVLVAVLGVVAVVLFNSAPGWVTGMLVGSAASNLLDRFVYGGVRDWMPLGFGAFAVSNNLADWMLFAAVLGGVLEGIVQFVHGNRSSHTTESA